MMAIVRKPGRRWDLPQLERFAALCAGTSASVGLVAGCHPRRGLIARYYVEATELRLYCQICSRFIVAISVGTDGRAH
jgi:hypothetical protein